MTAGIGSPSATSSALFHNGVPAVYFDQNGISGMVAYKNRAVNCDFSTWQVATSFSAPAQFSYLADQWANQSGANTSVTVSRQSAQTNGTTYCLRWLAGSTSSQFNIVQPIESLVVDSMKGYTVNAKVNLRVIAGNTRTYTIAIYKNSTGDTLTGGSWTQIAASTPIALSTTFQTIQCQVVIPNDGTANGLSVRIFDGQPGAATDYVEVQQAQLETVPTGATQGTAFEVLPPAIQLIRCQRYLPAWATGTMFSGYAYAANSAVYMVPFPVATRVPITSIGTAGTISAYALNAPSTVTPTLDQASTLGCDLLVTSGLTITAGQGSRLYVGASGLLYGLGAQLL